MSLNVTVDFFGMCAFVARDTGPGGPNKITAVLPDSNQIPGKNVVHNPRMSVEVTRVPKDTAAVFSKVSTAPGGQIIGTMDLSGWEVSFPNLKGAGVERMERGISDKEYPDHWDDDDLKWMVDYTRVASNGIARPDILATPPSSLVASRVNIEGGVFKTLTHIRDRGRLLKFRCNVGGKAWYQAFADTFRWEFAAGAVTSRGKLTGTEALVHFDPIGSNGRAAFDLRLGASETGGVGITVSNLPASTSANADNPMIDLPAMAQLTQDPTQTDFPIWTPGDDYSWLPPALNTHIFTCPGISLAETQAVADERTRLYAGNAKALETSREMARAESKRKK